MRINKLELLEFLYLYHGKKQKKKKDEESVIEAGLNYVYVEETNDDNIEKFVSAIKRIRDKGFILSIHPTKHILILKKGDDKYAIAKLYNILSTAE